MTTPLNKLANGIIVEAGKTYQISGPNCDNEDGYVYDELTVLWFNDVFVLYGKEGCWPCLHKWEHIHVKPTEAALTAHNQRWLDLADELKPEEANNEEYLEGINRGKEIARNRIRQLAKEMGE